MLIVVPVSSSDANLTPDFLGSMWACRTHIDHHILIVFRPSDARFARDLFAAIGRAAVPKSLGMHQFEKDGFKGWPLGPNFYWSETVRYLQKENNSLPWLWMELDCTPLIQGWADKLEKEYENCGMPFLGMYGYRNLVLPNGQETRPKHLVGVAVYPPQVPEYSKMWSKVPEINSAFDVVCEDEFVPKSTESKLMQHGFRTRNYMELPGGVLQGVDTNNFPGGIRYDHPIREGVVLHHGCEDGSLAKIVVSNANKALHGHSSFIPI